MKNQLLQTRQSEKLLQLALAISPSEDFQENCHHFFKTLKSLIPHDYGALWLPTSTIESVDEKISLRLSYSTNKSRSTQQLLSSQHFIPNTLSSQSYITVSENDSDFKKMIQEECIWGGGYIAFGLQNGGFLKIYADQPFDVEESLIQALLPIVQLFGKHHFTAALANDRANTSSEAPTPVILKKEEKLRKIITYSPDPVIVFNAAGRIQEWSNEAARLFGYTQEEVLGQPIHHVVKTFTQSPQPCHSNFWKR